MTDERLFIARVRATAPPIFPSDDWEGCTTSSPDHLARTAETHGAQAAGPSPPRAAALFPLPSAAAPLSSDATSAQHSGSPSAAPWEARVAPGSGAEIVRDVSSQSRTASGELPHETDSSCPAGNLAHGWPGEPLCRCCGEQKARGGLMRRTYRYRLYPTPSQAATLDVQLAEACDLYNAALQHRRDMWRDYRVGVRLSEQSAELPSLRAEGLVSSQFNAWSHQAVLKRVDRAFEAFYRRCKVGEKPGYPRFKPKQRHNTLDFSFAGNAGGIALIGDRLRVQGVGRIRIKLHRAIPAEAKLCEARITRRNGRWYVAISLANLIKQSLPATGHSVGLDLGISSFVVTSNGELISGPRAERTAAKAVRRAQRKVARRKRGSNRRRKAVQLLARHREHERNVRHDHAHKTARSLVERYDLIAAEKLNMRGLSRGMLARDCNDQGWGQFVSLLAEKAEEAARELILVDPRNTSQTCSACGALVPKALAQRVHSCACGYSADRDVNAARNILARATGGDAAVRRQRWGEEARAVA